VDGGIILEIPLEGFKVSEFAVKIEFIEQAPLELLDQALQVPILQ
jgi:hypothetical protein